MPSVGHKTARLSSWEPKRSWRSENDAETSQHSMQAAKLHNVVATAQKTQLNSRILLTTLNQNTKLCSRPKGNFIHIKNTTSSLSDRKLGRKRNLTETQRSATFFAMFVYEESLDKRTKLFQRIVQKEEEEEEEETLIHLSASNNHVTNQEQPGYRDSSLHPGFMCIKVSLITGHFCFFSSME